MSAFAMWLEKNRERFKQPGRSVPDVAIAASEEWGKLTDKLEWERRAREDKLRYEREIASQGLASIKLHESLEEPENPMSAFAIWLEKNRERFKQPGRSVPDVAIAAADEWGKLADKSEWERKAEEDKFRYKREMAEYNARRDWVDGR